MNKEIEKKLILCVDAGGSSTRYLVLDSDRKEILLERGGSGSPAVNKNAENDIYETIEKLIKQHHFHFEAIAIGMSGFALVNEVEYRKKLENLCPHIILTNDAYFALYSVLKEVNENGTVVISGTGAICLSINKGKEFYANGWGELLTERGSGYGLVRDFVTRMIHHHEETGTFSTLEQAFLDFLGYEKIEEFKMLFYRHSKNEVAKLCDFFIDQANEHQEEAVLWMKQNGEWLGLDTVNSLKRVEMDKKFLIGFRGGIFDNNPILISSILDTIRLKGYEPMLDEESNQPIYGGYYLAKRKGFI